MLDHRLLSTTLFSLHEKISHVNLCCCREGLIRLLLSYQITIVAWRTLRTRYCLLCEVFKLRLFLHVDCLIQNTSRFYCFSWQVSWYCISGLWMLLEHLFTTFHSLQVFTTLHIHNSGQTVLDSTWIGRFIKLLHYEIFAAFFFVLEKLAISVLSNSCKPLRHG